ncbi:MAG: 2-keto-4-pentenoate hydratase/2-oxohepta-3-ene-1,7-dioic acid hydratase in catechol pathway [Cocleimonas sp.]
MSFNLNLSHLKYYLIKIAGKEIMNSINYQNQPIQPSKIVCIGKNYMAHIEEMNSVIPEEPVIFMKPNSAISNQMIFNSEEEIHYEGEICLLIQDKQITALGFGLDLTKRSVQAKLKAKGLPWERAKAFDGSAQFSEFIPFSGSTDTLRLELSINGELIQQGGYELMLYKPEVILQEVNKYFTLEDGDIIMTGTPSGVGKINAGDDFLGKVFSGDDLIVEKQWIVQ